jgi:uncharacterized protein (TIGR02270 family)
VTFDVLARFDERLSRYVYKLSERPVLAERFLGHVPVTFAPGFTFVTAFVALRAGVSKIFDEVLSRLESEPHFLRPIASAISWLAYNEVEQQIRRLLAASSPALLRLGVIAAVAHRVDPGKALERALTSDVLELRASALEAVGRLAIKNFRPRLHAALHDADDTCRFWAAWSAVRLGDRHGIPVLGRFAAQGGAFASAACHAALRVLDTDQAVNAQRRLQSTGGHERLAVVAAGIIGDPALAGALFAAMESSTLARPAGAAFCLMTGCDLRRNDLDAAPPMVTPSSAAVRDNDSDSEGANAPSGQEVGDDLFEDEADDALAWPDVRRLRNWWSQNRHAFMPGKRYVAGLLVRPPEMAHVLRSGNQQQRAAAALEMALFRPDLPLLDVAAPAHSQFGTSDWVN